MKIKSIKQAIGNNIWRNLILVLTFSFLVSVILVVGFLKLLITLL